MVTVVVTGYSSRRSTPPRCTPTGNGLQRGQFCWPPLGRTVGRQRAATWPPLGRISWPPTHADLGRLEVVFRNAVDVALKNLAAARAWTQPWYAQESLFRGRKGEVAREAITTAVHRASRRKRRAPAHGGVIAELGFGFWRFLCGPAYLTALWVPALASAFPQHPAQGDPRRIRAEVEHRMERLHLLRNRIAHHEPIFRRDLERDHNQLLELIGWMCVDSRTWAAAISRTPETIAERSR